MDINPLDSVDADGEANTPVVSADATRKHLNSWVAITVALVATFTGICKVKDDNLVQAMQQSQADRVDHWNYYQAKVLREEIDRATADQLRAQASATPTDRAALLQSAAAHYDSLARHEGARKDSVRKVAENDQVVYDALNYRDDQFDLSDTLIAIAISLLAITALTQKRWLFFVALVPVALGCLMGLAGLMQWKIHPDAIARLLS